MAKLLNQSQFARKVGKSRGRISQLVRSGVITLKNNLIDPVQAEKQISGAIDSRDSKKLRSSKPIQGKGQSLTEVRRDHEILKKQLTELRLKVETGDLVSKGSAIEVLSLEIATASSHFWGLPKRMGDILFHKLLETFRGAVKGLPTDTQKIIEAGLVGLKFDGRDVEFELRAEIRKILEAMGRRKFEVERIKGNKEGGRG